MRGSFRSFVIVGLLAGCRSTSGSPPVAHPVVADSHAMRADDPQEVLPALRPSQPHVDLPPPASRTPAQELDGGVAWLNTDRPLRMQQLRGQVVLVDFWTYCCINCMHALPVLGQVEAAHRNDPVAVLGVHSAKFPGEREADRIAEAIARYDIHHPVVVDQENAIWNRWGVHGWPSVFVIDSEGRVVTVLSGEPTFERLNAVVNQLLDEGRSAHTLAEHPIAIHAPPHQDTGPLAFPGKVISLGGDRIAFSDSGHDRIVVAHTDGRVEAVIGQGIAGRADGDFEHAQFHHPQGVALEPVASGQPVQVLYVADTENHEIRRIDLAREAVTTIAGSGQLGRGADGAPVAALEATLRSPWDLVRVGDQLLVAMAGSHQIWTMGLQGGTIEPWAGSGREARMDGHGTEAAFAQPSGVTTDGTTLFVADSETSSVRAVDLHTREVHTVVGEDLFVFGDVDGPTAHARLQHPLGVALIAGEPNVVYVADTYNHKIKRIDLAAHTVRTLAGSAQRVPFFEPSGLTWTGEAFVVTDTNHHRLMRLTRDGHTATPIEFAGLAAPTAQVVDR